MHVCMHVRIMHVYIMHVCIMHVCIMHVCMYFPEFEHYFDSAAPTKSIPNLGSFQTGKLTRTGKIWVTS